MNTNLLKGQVIEEVSKELVERLQEMQVPQAEIVRLTGKNKGTISRIFNGKHPFSLDDMQLISCELNIPIITMIYNHMYKDIATDDKKFLNTLKKAEEGLAKNLASLEKMKKGKAAS